MARPSDYSEEIADQICERLADGESLRMICRDDGMPNKATVFRWLAILDEFRDRYARAREEQADSYADEIVTIADTAEDPQKARLQVDARKWVAAKLRPKKYGDRITQEHTGEGGGPVTFQTVYERAPD